ncbi:hypothetical protein GCM10011409_14230 [Lentibacillus populi]|uniref:Peptidase M50 domain-containing protein n=1 Tax=Lentibacillus populi TaxID=1827502 RepID=A0A9W5X4T4_9BACI|nr:hypothetical protein [Lentibacillus populi]GGB37943.1 hypothetical protein GCM10011409_14230 [Lentibacillus populi]
MGFLYIIGVPLTTLIHEIGHAAGLVCLAKDGVARIYLGDFSDSNKENFQIGRIHFHIVWGAGGICKYEKPNDMTTFQSVIVSLSGPLISAIFATILFFFLNSPINNYFLISGLFWTNLLQFIGTIIPIIYPKWWGPYGGYPSDGYRVLKYLKK